MTTIRIRIRAAAALALLLLALPAAAQDAFRPAAAFLQINDVYRVDAVENGEVGGLGRLVTLAERTRRETRLPVTILHAGDFIAPSLESRYFAGQQMIAALNFVHARTPVIAVPGNHEFDERQSRMLADALRESRFSWLAANVRLNTGDAAVDRRLGRDTVLSVGGMRVGIFSLTFLDAPRDYVEWDDRFVELAEALIRGLEARGAEAIVGLTHLHLEDDRRIAALRRAHPRLLWIAGGHEHFLIEQPLTDSTALITKADANARSAWRVTLGRRGDTPALRAEAVPIDASITPDPRYVAEVERVSAARMRERIPFYDQVIGRTLTRMDATEDVVRNAESAWGNYLADRMRTAYPGIRTDAAVLNGGAIRIDDGIQGDIRWEHLARTFGFPTRVALVWLTGRDLRERLLERSVSGGRGEGRFLQVSGIRYAFDRSRPEGQRVLEVSVERDGVPVPLDPAATYVVAVPDYLFGGGDGYTFRNRASLSVPPGPDLKLLVFDALSEAYARGEAIAPPVEGRIEDRTPSAASAADSQP
jgi:2',3'-cyclic-nucleotide 2'-phosphodiesterase (5'-nucleotidase family)